MKLRQNKNTNKNIVERQTKWILIEHFEVNFYISLSSNIEIHVKLENDSNDKFSETRKWLKLCEIRKWLKLSEIKKSLKLSKI